MEPMKWADILPQVDFYLKERILCFLNVVVSFKRAKCVIYTDGPKLRKVIKNLYWE